MDDLIAFLRIFYKHWMSAPSLDAQIFPGDLPDGLRLLYQELGGLLELDPIVYGHRIPFAAQDALMPLSRLKRVDGGMIEFAWENQGNWSCRCPAGPGDPPVYSNAADVWNAPARGFQKVCDSLSHFLITLSLQEAVMSAPCLMTLQAESFKDALMVPPEPVWLRGRYVNAEPTHDFYVVPDREVLLMDYAGLWLGTNDESALGVVRAESRRHRIQ